MTIMAAVFVTGLQVIERLWIRYEQQRKRNVWKYIVITECVVFGLFLVICVFWKIIYGYTPIYVLCDWLSDRGRKFWPCVSTSIWVSNNFPLLPFLKSFCLSGNSWVFLNIVFFPICDLRIRWIFWFGVKNF